MTEKNDLQEKDKNAENNINNTNNTLSKDFYYDIKTFTRPLGRYEIPRDYVYMENMYGFSCTKRNNIHFLDESIIVTSGGNFVQFMDISDLNKNKKYLFGLDGGGIGSISNHPSKKYISVAEKSKSSNSPNIYIYEYPSLALYRVLRKGTEKAYSCTCFSSDGKKFASVGSQPDFSLTIWDWMEEKIILRSKAFGQEIFHVSFAPETDGLLTTSGTGHIRFWKMADTFTGLKLQGNIGKFGKIELSDITSFCIFPDDKVLSSTERGSLLLWDGNFIKCEILIINHKLPHDGKINIILYDRQEQHILTGGIDGRIHFWYFESIDSADAMTDDTVAEILPKFTIENLLNTDTHHSHNKTNIGDIVKIPNKNNTSIEYLILDKNGYMYKLCLPHNIHKYDTYQVVVLGDYHSTSINYVAVSPKDYIAVTAGEDGSLRTWPFYNTNDNNNNKLDLNQLYFDSPITVVIWIPLTLDPTGKTIALGFLDGMIRIFYLDDTNENHLIWKRIYVFRPHNDKITVLQYSWNGSYLSTGSIDSRIFIFKTANLPIKENNLVNEINASELEQYIPIGFINYYGSIASLDWKKDDSSILVCSTNGKIGEFDVPIERNQNIDNFELHVNIKIYSFRRKRLLLSHEIQELEQQRDIDNKKNNLNSKLNLSNRLTNLNNDDKEMITIGEKEILSKEIIGIKAIYKLNSKKEESNVHTFYVILGGEHHGNIYLCSFNDIFPIESIPDTIFDDDISKKTLNITKNNNSPTKNDINKHNPLNDVSEIYSKNNTIHLKYSLSEKFIISGSNYGRIRIRSALSPYPFMDFILHDGNVNMVDTSFDDNFIISCGMDGQLIISRLEPKKILLLSENIEMIRLEKLKKVNELYDTTLHHCKAVIAKNETEEQINNTKQDITNSMLINNNNNNNSKYPDPYLSAAKAKAELNETILPEEILNEKYNGMIQVINDNNRQLFQDIQYNHKKENKNKITIHEVLDISGKNCYSILDAKKKLELDIKNQTSEQKKANIRLTIKSMQNEFNMIYNENLKKKLNEQLSENDLDVNIDYTKYLLAEGEKQCEEVMKEMEYLQEISQLKLSKLKKKYLNNVAVELITIKAFKRKDSVQSFRTIHLSKSLQEKLSMLRSQTNHLKAEKIKKNSTNKEKLNGIERNSVSLSNSNDIKKRQSILDITTANNMIKDENDEDVHNSKKSFLKRKSSILSNILTESNLVNNKSIPAANTNTTTNTTTNTNTTTTLNNENKPGHGFEVRKNKRQERKDKLELLKKEKPGENDEDPRDTEAISFSKENMGDYKLKTAKDYVVPESQRVNTEKKKNQMLLLEESMYIIKMKYNKKLFTLRSLKKDLIQEINKYNIRIKEINYLLSKQSSYDTKLINNINLYEPSIDTLEWPENREIVTNDEIDREMNLNNNNKSMNSTSLSNNDNKIKVNTNIPIKSYGIKILDLIYNNDKKRIDNNENIEKSIDSIRSTTNKMTNNKNNNNIKNKKIPMDLPDNELFILQLEIEKKKLISKINQCIDHFDSSIYELRKEKLYIELYLKEKEIQLLILYQEQMLLTKFESKDNQLVSKLDKSRIEKNIIMSEINDCMNRLNNKRNEIDIWQIKDKNVYIDFNNLINDTNNYYTILYKIFKRKIKRNKKRDGTINNSHLNKINNNEINDNEDDNDEDDLNDDENDNDNDEDEDDDDNEDICPEGCDQLLYNKILELREKRLDNEEIINELNKSIEDLKRNYERQLQKQKQIDKELNQTQDEIQAFQTEKQHRFNELDIVLPLDSTQLMCMEKNSDHLFHLPENAENCFIFSESGLKILNDRIHELQFENRSLRQQFKDLHKHHHRLKKDKKLIEEQINNSTIKSNELQLLKFGQIIDMEALDKISINKNVNEIKNKIHFIELNNEKEIQKYKIELSNYKMNLLIETEKNTKLLNDIAIQSRIQYELENQLNKTDLNTSLNDTTPKLKQEIDERNKLIQVVKLQAREIDALKVEIGMLRGKDGNLYAPTQPHPLSQNFNFPNSSTSDKNGSISSSNGPLDLSISAISKKLF